MRSGLFGNGDGGAYICFSVPSSLPLLPRSYVIFGIHLYPTISTLNPSLLQCESREMLVRTSTGTGRCFDFSCVLNPASKSNAMTAVRVARLQPAGIYQI